MCGGGGGGGGAGGEGCVSPATLFFEVFVEPVCCVVTAGCVCGGGRERERGVCLQPLCSLRFLLNPCAV